MAHSGDAAPGTEAGTVFTNSLDLLAIDIAGHVGIRGRLTGPSVDGGNDIGAWYEHNGILTKFARADDQVPGTDPGVQFTGALGGIHDFSVNASGQIVFGSHFSGPGISYLNDYAVWTGVPGSLNLVLQEFSPDPGTGGLLIVDEPRALINNAGELTVIATLHDGNADPLDNYGLWSGYTYPFNLVRKSGAYAPTFINGQIVNVSITFVPGNTALNPNGSWAFYGQSRGAGVDPSTDEGVWVGNSGTVTPVAYENWLAQGTNTGEVYTQFSNPEINRIGDITFQSTITGGLANSGNDNGIWTYSAGSTSLIVREGDVAPGLPGGYVFGELMQPKIGGLSETVFTAGVIGPGNNGSEAAGLWRHLDGALIPLAVFGEHAPGTSPTSIFKTFSTDHKTNDTGYTLFHAVLEGPDIVNGNSEGLWISSPNGGLALVVRNGMTLDTNPDPHIQNLRVVEQVFEYELNNNAQVAFSAHFTDGTVGIFTATLGLPGDLDGDGFVGINDLNIVLGNWNQNVPPADPLADPSGDGFIGIDDLTTVLGNWNTGTPPDTTANIPEPSTLAALVGLASLGLMRLRKE